MLQVDKTAPKDKVILGDEYERGIQPDMGGAHYIGVIVDMQNPGRHNRFSTSDSTNDEDNPSFKGIYPGIVYS